VWSTFLTLNTTMAQDFTIKSYQIPSWLKEFIFEYGCYRCEETESPDTPVDKLVIYESEYLANAETWHQRVASGTVGRLLILNDHPFVFTDQVLSRINQLPFANRIAIFCQGYWSTQQNYPNVISEHVNFHEHFFSHHFIFLLSRQLQQKRKITKDFLWYTLPKDPYRKQFVDSFRHSDLLNNSITSFGEDKLAFYKQSQDRMTVLKQKYGTGQWTNGLQCYGAGLPNMKAYEQVACEIVLETANSGSWHLSEKFFRPIGFAVPLILLCSKKIFDTVKGYGYKFYDYDNFYAKFQGTEDVAVRVQLLEKFMSHIKNDKPSEMHKIADQNYDHFWNNRKNIYYDRVMNAWRRLIGGNNLLDNIYNDLDT